MALVVAGMLNKQVAAELGTREITVIEKHQRDAIVAALARSGGRVSGAGGAAELLGMNASTLFSRMSVLGLRQKKAETVVSSR